MKARREDAITEMCNARHSDYGCSEHYSGSEECSHLFTGMPEYKRVKLRKEMSALYDLQTRPMHVVGTSTYDTRYV